MKIPDSIDERQKMFEFKEKPVVAGILLDFLLDVLLMPYRFVNYLKIQDWKLTFLGRRQLANDLFFSRQMEKCG